MDQTSSEPPEQPEEKLPNEPVDNSTDQSPEEEQKPDTYATENLPPLLSELPPGSDSVEITKKKKRPTCLIILLFVLVLLIIAAALVYSYPHIAIPKIINAVYPESSNPCMYKEPEFRDIPSQPIPSSWKTVTSQGVNFSTPLNVTETEPGSRVFRSPEDDIVAVAFNPYLVFTENGSMEEAEEFLNSVDLSPTEFTSLMYEFSLADFTSEKSALEYLEELPRIVIIKVMATTCSPEDPFYKFETDNRVTYQHTEVAGDGKTLGLSTIYTDPTTGEDTIFDILISSDKLTQEDIDLIVSSISYTDTPQP